MHVHVTCGLCYRYSGYCRIAEFECKHNKKQGAKYLPPFTLGLISIMAGSWDLAGCCQSEEYLFLSLYGAYAVFTLMLGSTGLMKPMRLLAVFVHEFGHARSVSQPASQ